MSLGPVISAYRVSARDAAPAHAKNTTKVDHPVKKYFVVDLLQFGKRFRGCVLALRFQVFIEPGDHTLLHVELMSILL